MNSDNARLLFNLHTLNNPYACNSINTASYEIKDSNVSIKNHYVENFSYKNNSDENLFKNVKCQQSIDFGGYQNNNLFHENNNNYKGLTNESVNNKNFNNFYDFTNNVNTSSIIYNKLNNENDALKENKTDDKKRKLKKKSFECKFENCQKKFTCKWILNRHFKSHFNFSLFKCESCSKSYKSKENLSLHVKNKHFGIKPYNCNFCNSSFSHRNGIFKLKN